MARAVVGLFDSFTDAQAAVSDLVGSGFAREDISLVANNAAGEFDNVDHAQDGVNVSHGAGDLVKGAVKGGLYGGLTALAATVALALIPGIGPIAAIGPLSAFLGGAALGATAGGIIGGLTGLGIPEGEAGYYAEGIRRGGTLVTVHAAETRADEAMSLLNRHHAVDIDTRAEYYRSTGFSRYDDTLPAYTAEQIAADRARYSGYRPAAGTVTTGNSRYYDVP
jgi:hypothetical protein